MPSLKDRVIEQEKKEGKKQEKKQSQVLRNMVVDEPEPQYNSKFDTENSGKSAVRGIAGQDIKKDKQISAKVNEISYAKFTRINQAQGLSNNSALNMIINRYIRENSGLLDE